MIQSTSRLIMWTALLVVGLAVRLVCAQDPLQVGPTIYKLLFENERVRVFEVRFKPGERIAMHSHPDHMVYVLADGQLQLSSPDGKSVEVGLQAGQTLWIPAQTHAAENVGATDAHSLVVELKENESGSATAPKVGDTVVYKFSRQGYVEGKVEKIEARYEIRHGTSTNTVESIYVHALPKAGEKMELQAGDVVVARARDSYWAGSIVKSVSPDLIEVEVIDNGNMMHVPHERVIKVSPASAAEFKKYAEEVGFLKTAKAKRPQAPAGYNPKPGERVVAEWTTDAWWVGEIVSVSSDKVEIKWPSFPKSELQLEKIMPYPKAETATALPKQGDFVLVKPADDKSQWHYAQVTSVSGQTAEVKFADGKTRSIEADEYIALN